MNRSLVGTVRFQDARLGQIDEFHVCLLKSLGRLELALYQDALGITGIGGDIEVAFDGVKAQELLRMLTSAVRRAEVGDSIRWERVGSVQYTWSDEGGEEDSSGEILMEACRGTVRLVIKPSSGHEDDDYVATMDLTTFRKLVSLVEESLVD